MYDFRDHMARQSEMIYWSTSTQRASRRTLTPWTTARRSTPVMKTQSLKMALDEHKFDVAFGGARRGEESPVPKSVCSPQDLCPPLGPQEPAPRAGTSTTAARTPARASACSRSQTGPSSTSGSTSTGSRSRSCRSTSAERPVVERDGMLMMVDDDRLTIYPDEQIQIKRSGSAPSAATH